MVEVLPALVSSRLVAELGHDRGRLTLLYVNGAGPALGQRLPVREAAYADEECRAFIANLLPEGDWRGLLCQRLGLPVTDDFRLLQRLGHDCAGAVTFEEAEVEAAYTPLPESQLRLWLKDARARPSPEVAAGLRRALSGAQDKLVLHVVEGQPYLCERGAPSTVILKPDIVGSYEGVELSALNELFCMHLARAVGLRAPRSYWFAGAYAVERYDRVYDGSQLRRIHQEDFAQLLGVAPERKYEVGFRECFEVADRYATDGEATRRELLDRLLFNLLIGNGDAHCKNFALLFTDERAVLAPAYDLLCTQVYPALSDAFVMRLGPARRQSELTAQAWQDLARDARLPLEWLKQRGQELCAAVQLALGDAAPQVSTENPALAADIYPARRREDFLRKLADTMVGNCKRIARSLHARA
ncbi:MAG: type II toxin-antitoxin system HipA family toxin [Myxococcales bacterium]|nr:MAG: type II toxin-antitoxin system HipA family toxin [Myxococcales bacterium]